jgi:ferredoxin
MERKIIHIDETKCNGCGACAKACHEGAIGMVNGKAKLLRDDYCDGLGDCLPGCPTGAITFTTREAAAYDKQAVLRHKAVEREVATWLLAEHPFPAVAPVAEPAFCTEKTDLKLQLRQQQLLLN